MQLQMCVTISSINDKVYSAINRNTVIFPLIIMGNHGGLYKFWSKRKHFVITYHLINRFICQTSVKFLEKPIV